MENSMEVTQKTKNRITIWSGNPTPGNILGQTIIQKDTYTPMLIAALFTIAKTWKQPNCPSADEWLKKIWCIYNGILLNNKKEWNNVICRNMDATRDYHTKSARERPTPYDIIYMWILKYDQKETHKQRTDLVLPRERGCTGSLGLVYVNYLLHLEF